MMNARTDILKFQDMSITVDSAQGAGIGNLSLSLTAGDLAVVFAEKEQVRILWADAAEGLVAPAQGKVTFLGEDWRTMTANRVAQQRGRIGRVFEGECWRSDLYVDQNITSTRQLKTRRALEEIEGKEAIQLRRVFGLPELPRGRPGRGRWQDLLMAACVRAFLGAPDLILLENPTSGHSEGIVPLLKTVHAARQRGAAVLWMTNDLQLWNHPELRASTRCRMDGSQVQLVGETERIV